jgi:hypothetical protein
MLQLFTQKINKRLPMNTIDIFLEAGTALVVAGLILKRRAEEAALEAEPIPVPVRSRR